MTVEIASTVRIVHLERNKFNRFEGSNGFTKESIVEKTYSSENLPSPLFSKEG